ncbi:hypothetical protein K431DRAFT_216832 [Polychaeton citri CBS 116435]|uniref:Protein sip5 n=1 Tax=Polychaeton citri CBS 116435 TaxID=1314669 RepID=A0A9P4QEF8_9PEZI|nr:hypothetical protein K431DRAFT_216832 [Polychaeton citri CBS 116435]
MHGQRGAGGRSSRADLSFLHLGRDRADEQQVPERPRETKQEREARRAERERQARLKERERSMREEHVDGGFLVTVGVYTGVEDFNKGIVRQLQIERRIAPFWRGLDDHSDSWTEYQLVAAARGLPIPAPDDIPPEWASGSTTSLANANVQDASTNSANIPISSHTQSYQSDNNSLSVSHPGPGARKDSNSAGQLIRGRAKTLASLATGNKSQSPDMTPQELRLPDERNVNGQPLEAFLYKDASECPICFMYYPPYLNQTRCCDQPICSECFVQIKRPDPHPPEHEQPGEQQQRPPEEEAETLVSEVAACPFCVTPEFGVTYEPPPFRRGLIYAHQQHSLSKSPAMSSSASLASGAANNRRRGMSLSAVDPHVVTTDRVRPDWAKKLADARAHALRRSAAATALHNAAYVLGNQDTQTMGTLSFGRRRRTLFRDSPSVSGSGTPVGGSSSTALRSLVDLREQSGSEGQGRTSRRNRVDDLEDLMMMEAIRLSLAAEEERKRKEEKDAKKGAKKRAKEEKKEAKQAEKAARKNSSGPSMYRAGTNDSASSWTSNHMIRSTSNLGREASIPEEQVEGKGKGPAQDFAGFRPISDPTSTLNTEMKDTSSASNVAGGTTPTSIENPQKHLEQQRASVQAAGSKPIPVSGAHNRQLSTASSVASSYLDSGPGSFQIDSHLASANASLPDTSRNSANASAIPSGEGTPIGGAGLEPMLNFSSLTAMVSNENKSSTEGEHVEHAENATEATTDTLRSSSVATSSSAAARASEDAPEKDSSDISSRGSNHFMDATERPDIVIDEADATESTSQPRVAAGSVTETKNYGDVNVLDHGHAHEATQ